MDLVYVVCVFFFLFFIFFFQAEDGIRDLVRSRGLGDVYKRQGLDGLNSATVIRKNPDSSIYVRGGFDGHYFHSANSIVKPVSYTHLTLPTSDLV